MIHALRLSGAISLFALALASATPPLADADGYGAEPSKRPWAPTDHALFTPLAYPDSPAVQSPAGSEPTADEVATMFDNYLAEEFPGAPDRQQAARAAFNDPTAVAKIPSASLRAALAALTGSFAEPAIDYVLHAQTAQGHPKISAARFIEITDSRDPDARVISDTSTADPDDEIIEFNAAERSENPFLWTSIWAHEPLHSDSQVTPNEEAIANGLDQLIYLAQLSHHPWLASSGSGLARTNNTNSLVRLNSGAGSELGLFESNGDQPVIPGNPARLETSWAAFWVGADHSSSPGNDLLAAYLPAVQEPGGPQCSATAFSDDLLKCLDANGNDGLASDQLVAAANAMKLDTSAATSSEACDRAIAKLKKDQAKLNRLRQHHASKNQIKKAKRRVKKDRSQVHSTC